MARDARDMAQEKEWATLFTPTPDADHYELRVISDGRDGPRALKEVPRDGVLPGGLGEVYGFQSRVPGEDLARLLTEGRDMLRRVTHEGALRLPPVKQFPKVVDAGGREVAVDLLLGGGGGALVGGGAAVTPDGFVWVAAEPAGGRAVGDLMELDDRCVFASERDALFPSGGGFVRCELVEMSALETFVAKRRRLLGLATVEPDERGEDGVESGRAAELRRRLRGGAAGGGGEAEQQTVSGGDVRTLAIDYDGQGEQYKDWRALCPELSSPTFQDWPLEGPRTAVHLCKHMGKHRGLPSGFLDRCCRSKRVGEGDRVHHEMRALVDALEVGGVYDQLNLGSLAMTEVIARRLQTIFDACEPSATKPNFESASFFSGSGAATDAVSPELRNFAARRARGEAEIEKSRQKVRELKGRPPPAGADKGGGK